MNISKNAFGNLTLGYDIPDTDELLNAIDSCESDILNLNEQISALDSSVSDLQNQVICKRVFTKDINPSIAQKAMINGSGQIVLDNAGLVTYPYDIDSIPGLSTISVHCVLQYGNPRAWAIYDQDEKCLKTSRSASSSQKETFEETLVIEDIRKSYPTAKTIRFGTYNSSVLNISYTWVDVKNVSNLVEDIEVLNQDIEALDKKSKITNTSLVDVPVEIDRTGYITYNGTIQSDPTGVISQKLPLDDETYLFTTILQYNNPRAWAIYNKDDVCLAVGPNASGSQKELHTIELDFKKMKEDYPAANYILLGTYDRTVFSLQKKTKTDVYLQGVYDELNELKSNVKYEDGEFVDMPEVQVSSGGIWPTGIIADDPSGYVTDPIAIDKDSIFRITSRVIWANPRMIGLYDMNQNPLIGLWYNEESPNSGYYVFQKDVICSELLEKYPSARYIRFSSYGQKLGFRKFRKYDDVTDESLSIKELLGKSDYLYGKKWLACGDSFSETAESETYDPYYKMYSVYPLFITKRHNMITWNESKSGGAMHYNGKDPRNCNRNCFVNRLDELQDKISEADYITFAYGINEQHTESTLSALYNKNSTDTLGSLIKDKEDHYLSEYFDVPLNQLNQEPYKDVPLHGVTYGQIDSNDISTIHGAWNVTLTKILELNPDVKIGIIINDTISQTMCEALISIGNYWGVPVLNMCNDPQVPLLISRKPGLTINPYAIQQRRKAFIISEENGHPSKIGHEYRSTIIENYMRSL